MSARILLIDDDAELRDAIRRYLITWGFHVSVLHDARSLERRLQCERPDLIVLDLMMPDVDGLTALRGLRASGDDIPVLMLTARANEDDRIAGLECGADDYLGKPFNPRELVARIQSVLRRRGAIPNATTHQRRPPYTFGGFTLDFQSRTLNRGETPLPLSASEFALLQIFVNYPMCTLTRRRLLKSLHGPESETADRGIDVQVCRLRRIVETDPSTPRFIQTVRGGGYVFVPDLKEHTAGTSTHHSHNRGL